MNEQNTIKKVDANNLKIGMYVSQFDRPWLETSFFYHKFLIKSDKQIDKIKRYCSYVYIDTAKGEDIKASVSATEEDKKIEVEMKEKIEDALKREAPLEDKVSFNQELKEAKQFHDEAKNFIKTMLDDVRLGKSISSTNAKKVVDNMTESVMRNRDALLCLTQLKKKDEYTSFHSISVSILCLAFGRHMGYQKNTLKTLGLGGLLHDIGKMKIPAEVLNKAGRLTEEEFEIMRRHVVYGAEILSDTHGIHESVMEVPLQHHERYNGTGYPKGLKGDQIGVFGMLSSIADVYDAITSNRVYNTALQPQEALKRMFEWRGKDFHPLLMERFIQCVGIYPIGSVVRFQSGEVGLVMSINMMNITRPKILIFMDASLNRINPYKMADLCSPDSSKYSIKEVLNTDKYGINIQDDFKGILLDEHISCC